MKRALVFLMGGVVLTAAIHAAVWGDYVYTDNGDGTCTITDYFGPGFFGGNVTIPDTLNGLTVTNIGDYAFYYCPRLTDVTIPDSVITLGYGVFYDSYDLMSVTIGNGVTIIGNDAFYGCESLTTITVDALNTDYSSLDGVLFNKAQTLLIKYPQGRAGKYIIPGGVTTIGEWAFYECTHLTGVTISNGVATIESSAFELCVNLKGVTIGSGVTTIGEWAFYFCVGLTSITIPDNVTTIENWAFADCASLRRVTIGSGVTAIGDGVFAYCSGLACACFKGNPPALGGSYVFNDVNTTVYYLPVNAANWTATFGGQPTAVWPLSIADVDTNGDVNLLDFYTLAAAWQAVDGVDAEYDPLCDISDPVDGVINESDLIVFANEWLITPCQ